MNRFSRRTFLSGLAAGAAGVAVAACVPQPVMQEAASEPDEQTLYLAMTGSGAARHFGPMDVGFGVVTGALQYAMPFKALPDGTVAPYLVSSYEINDDATLYTLHIDPRAVWSDGSPVTASQIKAAWEWQTDPSNAWVEGGLASIFLNGVVGFDAAADGEVDEIEGLVATDESTLEIHLAATDRLLPFSLSQLYCGVFNVEDAEGDPDYFLKANPLVNGPYQITEVHPTGLQAVFSPNPNWWGDEPVITKIVMQAFQDQMAMGIAMENGQIDVGWFGDRKVAKETMERIGGYTITVRTTSFAYASFKADVEPVDDVNLRKALLHAIDFETMVDVAGQGTKWVWPAPGLVEGFQCHDPATAGYTEFNVDLAKEYLAKSRYETGDQVPKIRMTPNGTDPVNIKSLQIMQEAWRVHLGITDVEIKEQPSGYGDDERLIAIERQSTGASPADAAVLARNTFHSNSPAASHFMGGYKNERVDELIEKALAMSREDPEFCPTIREAEDLFLDDAMLIPLYTNHRPVELAREIAVAQPWAKNVFIGPAYYFLPWVEPMMTIEK